VENSIGSASWDLFVGFRHS